jgi:hypothetical protein
LREWQEEKDGSDNPFCENCKEEHCAVSSDNTCAMIRVYLSK